MLADDRFSKTQIAANRLVFFESGCSKVEAILTTFEKHFGPLARGSALDHGYGVRRLTMPLAAKFGKVVGVDVSRAMLVEAKANCAAGALRNVQFAFADDRLPRVRRTFDFVNSAMVLQHVPVRRGEVLIKQVITRVANGGGFHLHLSIRSDLLCSRALWWASANIPGVKLLQNVLAGRPWKATAMPVNNYSLSSVVDLLLAAGSSKS